MSTPIPADALTAIDAALALLPSRMDSPEARVMMLAIGLQESRFQHRQQLVGNPPKPTGPAKGLWQFERGGGATGVVHHAASRYWMHSICQDRGVKFNATALWNAVKTDDILAAAAARLLLFTDPKRLPDLGDEAGARRLYLRTWRPGKFHPETWPGFYAQAVQFVGRSR